MPASTASGRDGWLPAGRVGRPHGLDGSFHVTRPRPALLPLGGAVRVAETDREVVRRAGTDDRPILRLAGIDGRAAVEALRGADLWVARGQAPAARRGRVVRRRPRRPARRRRPPAGGGGGAARPAAVVRGARGRRGGGADAAARPARARLRALRRPGRRGRRRRPRLPGRHAPATWPPARTRRRARARRLGLMQLDVVTLFPEAFEGWFAQQRHVVNALELGHELRTLNPRDHSPLSGGQVDDTPFGGGAGMVLRVDVMEAALRGFYGVDPSTCAGSAGSSRSCPAAGCSTTATSTSSPPSRRSRCCAAATRASTSASSSTSARTRCRSAATSSRAARSRRWSSATPCCASCPARSATRTPRVEESFSRRAGGRSGVPALHAAGRAPRLEGPGRPALRPPRGDPHLAPGAQPRAWGVGGRRFAILTRRADRCHTRPARAPSFP